MFPYFSFLFLCSFCIQTVIAEPLQIEINEGINSIPHETGDVDKSISSSFTQTIDESDIRPSQFDLGQVIETQTGIKVRRSGGVGSFSQFSIRGKSSDQVIVYLDGVPINSASSGGVDLSQIPVGQIARIEIYKDVIPVEFSETSNGGVINIITHRTKNEKTTNLNTSMGSFSTFSTGIKHFNHYADWQFVTSGEYITAKNDFPFTFQSATPSNSFNHETQDRHNNEFKQYNVIVKAKHHINNDSTFQLKTDLTSKTKNIPSFNNKADGQASLVNDNRLVNINYTNDNFRISNLKLLLGFETSNKNSKFDDSAGDIGIKSLVVDEELGSISSKVYLKFQRKNYQLVNNNNLRLETLKFKQSEVDISDNRLKLNNKKSNKRYSIATAFQAFFFFQEKRLIVSPAFRFNVSHDRFRGDTLNETLESLENRDLQNLSRTFYTVSPQFGVRYSMWGNTDFKFNIGRYYRLPNYIELFGTQGYIGSNETLKPEKGINIDTGFEHLNYPRSEILTKFLWNFSIYHSLIKNEISYSFDARGIGKPANNKRSVITGIENSFLWEFDYNIELSSNTTLQSPLNKSDKDNVKLLAGRSYFTQNTKINITFDNLAFFVEHNWESFYYYDTEQKLPSDTKSELNAGINLYEKKVQYSLIINNIFNQQTKDYYAQYSPGISVFLSANFKFS